MGADGKLVGLKRVLLVPGLCANLLSTKALSEAGMKMEMMGTKVFKATLDGRVLWDLRGGKDMHRSMWEILVLPWKEAAARLAAEAVREGHASHVTSGGGGDGSDGGLLVHGGGALPSVTPSTGETDWLTAHCRFGHVALPLLQQLLKEERVKGLRIKGEPKELGSCETFLTSKFSRFPFHSAVRKSSDPVELVHVDLVGPMKVKGDGGALYSMTMVDDYTRLTWYFPLANKSDAARVIIEEWLPMVERESGKRVKAIRSDRGGEFLGAEFRSWLKRHGIKQQLTMASTPESNGVAERANRTIIEGGRTIFVDSCLPLRFWPLAIHHATVIKNRVLTHVGGHHWVPMEKWSGKKPLVDIVRVFVCMGLVHVPKEKCDKLQVVAVWAFHLCLAWGSKGWLMWDPKSNTIFTTRDAKFMEGLMFKELSERGRSKVTIPLGIEVGTNDPLLIPIELSSSSGLTEVSNDLGGAEGEAENMEGVVQQGEAPIAKRGDTEEEVQLPTPSPKLPPRRTTQGKCDDVRGGAKEGAAKERPKKAAHPRDFLKYERLGGPKSLLVQEEEDEEKGAEGEMDQFCCFGVNLPHEPASMEEALAGDDRETWLNKAIYGLKQAPRCWYARLVEALGLKIRGCNESLFMTEGEEEKVFLLVYVDGILLFSPSLERIKEVQGNLKETFPCKALGSVGYYPGLHVERDERTAPHSSSFPPTTAPLQTLHMDMWGPARVSGQGRERYFLLVVDDYTRYTTVFPLRSKGEVSDVLIPWIRTVRLQLRERFGQDLPVLRLHSDRGGEFSSVLLRDFCRGEGILQSFTLPDSPQQNGIAERRIGLVMEVARTSMIHAAAPHFLWPFAVRYDVHQLNLWPRVSLPETSPTLCWTGKVGDASVFRDVTFDESVPFYCLFPFRSASPSPPPLFLAPGPPQVDPLLPQGPTPSGVSQVDPLSATAPVQVAIVSGAAPDAASGGAASGGAAFGGAEPGGAGSEGAGSRGAEPVGAEPEGVEPGGAESEGAESRGAEPQGAASSGGAGDTGAGGAAVTTGAGGTGGTLATGPGSARTSGAGVAGTAGAVDPEAGGARETEQPRPYFVPLLQQVLGVRPSTGLPPPFLCPPPDQSQPPLQPASPLPAPSPYTEQSGGLTERRKPVSRPVLPVCTARRAPRSRPPPVPSTHTVALRPSSVPLRVSLPAPPGSSLPEVPDPASDQARTATPTIAHLLANAVTDPSFESAATSALVAELLDFVAACRLDYATALVAESMSASPPSVGGECALGTDVLEDRQEDFECLAATVPRLASLLLAPEGDPDAPDIPTPRSYAEAITGPHSSQWQQLWMPRWHPGSPQAPTSMQFPRLGPVAVSTHRHRTKHIALRYFLARELQQRGQLRLAYMATRANTADVFTKALLPGDHQRFATVLGLVPTLPHLLTA
ncbi:unnamed protein product [Closterium sp. NIES-54]